MAVTIEVIAEMGSSHDGLFVSALELVRLAKQCGADSVKVQYFGDPDALAKQRGLGKQHAETYRRYNVPEEWLEPLAVETRRHGMRFICSVFRADDAALVARYADDIKVSSFEAEDEKLLAAIAAARVPKGEGNQRVIVSLGQGKSAEAAARILGRDVVTLHCVSAYPAPLTQLNLQRIATQGMTGYSDHSANEDVGALAVAAGARVIEVHYRMDATPLTNPDYMHSLNPSRLATYVERVREAARMLGDGADVAQPVEKQFTVAAEQQKRDRPPTAAPKN
jgi:N-acetylneuraminate synthase